MPANLAVLMRPVAGAVAGILRRRGGPVVVAHGVAAQAGAVGAHGQVLHATAHLQLAALLLEELDVPAAIAHLRVEPRSDGLVVGLRSHGIRGVHQSLFPLDLPVDVLDPLVFVHLGGGSTAGVVVGNSCSGFGGGLLRGSGNRPSAAGVRAPSQETLRRKQRNGLSVLLWPVPTLR